MKQLIRLLLGLIPALLFACDYSPSGSHYEDLNPTPRSLDITLNPNQDTIRVRGSVELSFNTASLLGRTVYAYRLMLGGRIIDEGSSSIRKLSFQSNNYHNGYHKLRLLLLTDSGTGSLGDKAGAETMEHYKTWVVHIDNSPPKAVVITQVQPADGRLKIEWQKYEGTEFLEYQIRRSFGPYNTSVCAFIKDPAQTSWVDDGYIGGQVSYTVVLYVSSQGSGIFGPATPYDHPLPQLVESSYNEARELHVRFSATPFFNNFAKYELKLNNTVTASITGWRDTLVTIPNPEFGAELHAELLTYSNKTSSSDVPVGRTQATIQALGIPWGPHALEAFLCRTSSGFFYTASSGRLKIIDAATLQVKQERDVSNLQHGSVSQNAVSQDGRFMYAILDNRIHRLNPTTLQTLETYELKDLLPNSEYYLGALSGCSNNNRLIVHATKAGTFQSDVFVVDMAPKRVLFLKEASMYLKETSISPDGKTIQIEGNLHLEQHDGTWQQLNSYGYEYGRVLFHPTKPLFYTTNYGHGKDIVFYSTTTGTRQHILHPEAWLSGYQIDAGTGYLYGKENDMLYIYNIETDQLLRKQKLVPDANVFLYGNRLFSEDRYIDL